MRVHYETVIDIETGIVEFDDYDDNYNGIIDLCKYDEAKKRADKLEADNTKMQHQVFKDQMDTIQKVKGGLAQYLSGNVGFDPTQLALMKSGFLNSNSQAFNQARSGVSSALLARGAGGGSGPVGGDYTRGLSGLYGAEANSQAGGLAGIDVQNLQQALTNKFNTASLFSGQAANQSSDIGTFGAGRNNALNTYSSLSMAPTFWNSFGPSLGSTLGKTLGGGNQSSYSG